MSEFLIENLDFCQSARSRSEEIEGGIDIAVRASVSALTRTDGLTQAGVGAAVASAIGIGKPARAYVFTSVIG